MANPIYIHFKHMHSNDKWHLPLPAKPSAIICIAVATRSVYTLNSLPTFIHQYMLAILCHTFFPLPKDGRISSRRHSMYGTTHHVRQVLLPPTQQQLVDRNMAAIVIVGAAVLTRAVQMVHLPRSSYFVGVVGPPRGPAASGSAL